MLNTPLHEVDETKARILARQVGDELSAKPKRFPKAVSSLQALYRICAATDGMELQLYVGDRFQTVWVQNFELVEAFSTLAFSANEPDRAAALVAPADVGIGIPVFLNPQVYCGPELVREFCSANASELSVLRLSIGERIAFQRKQIRLRLVTHDINRIMFSLGVVGQIFHRYMDK
jgi:hypothetical protein